MPITPLEIIDTVVKIGLGALISGYATYRVTRLTHTAEEKKARAQRICTAIEKTTESLENYFVLLHPFIESVISYVRTVKATGAIPDDVSNRHFLPHEQAIQGVRHEKAKASSRLRLIGALDAVNQINEIISVENAVRQVIYIDKRFPTEAELTDFKDRVVNARVAIYAALEKTYLAA